MEKYYDIKNPNLIEGFVTEPLDATPSSPNAGYVRMYQKTDGTWYWLDSDGNETAFGSGGGGGGVTTSFIKLGSPQTEINITGLDLDTSKLFFVKGDILSNASSNRIRLFFNGDTNEANYSKSQIFQNGPTGVSSAEGTTNATPISGLLSSGATGGFTGTIKKFYNGTNTKFIAECVNYYQNNRVATAYIYKTVAGDVNLTQVTLSSNQTNGLGTYTEFMIKS